MSREKWMAGLWLIIVLLLPGGCMGKGNGSEGDGMGADNTASNMPTGLPAYERETTQIQLTEGFNQFIMDYSEYGILYYKPTGDSYQNYDFYFYSFADKANSDCIFQKEGGYLRDLSAVKRADGMHYCVLWVDDSAAYISDYDSQGKLFSELMLADSGFEKPGKFPIIQALAQGGFLIGLEDKVYLVSEDGRMEHTIVVEDENVRKLVELEDGRCFVVYQGAWKNGSAMGIAELTARKDALGEKRSLPVSDERVFAFEGNGLVYCDGDYAYLFDMDEEKDEKLVNLKKKSIISSQIQCLSGNSEEMFLVLVDQSEGPDGILGIHLTRKEGYESEDGVEEGTGSILKNSEKKRQKYAADGRRIIHVAVSKEEGLAKILEFRGQKYSQKKDQAVVEVEEFEGSVEDYLGRGERPDVIVLPDQTVISSLVELGALADMTPLFEKQDQYPIDNILPKAREALSVGDGLYAMARQFELLFRITDGSEEDARGNCTVLDYLRWYDAYLDQNGLQGMTDQDLLFFALMPRFYNEEEGRADFESEQFKELMEEYKRIRKKYAGEWVPLAGMYNLENTITNRYVNGPRWDYSFRMETSMLNPDIKLAGIPTPEGDSITYMKIDRPMAILNASECKEEALDFILYYCQLKVREIVERDGSIYEAKVTNELYTSASFWVREDYLREDIWETDVMCWDMWLVEPAVGMQFYGNGISANLSDDRKEMLRGLMDSAVGITKAQKDVYGMYLEEMDGYLNGNKDLDACCDILQNRVRLYLME